MFSSERTRRKTSIVSTGVYSLWFFVFLVCLVGFGAILNKSCVHAFHSHPPGRLNVASFKTKRERLLRRRDRHSCPVCSSVFFRPTKHDIYNPLPSLSSLCNKIYKNSAHQYSIFFLLCRKPVNIKRNSFTQFTRPLSKKKNVTPHDLKQSIVCICTLERHDKRHS